MFKCEKTTDQKVPESQREIGCIKKNTFFLLTLTILK